MKYEISSLFKEKFYHKKEIKNTQIVKNLQVEILI
jgi:hypothetical protein